MHNINKDLDDHSICFISNVNNEAEYEGAKNAILELEIPSGYKVEILGVRHAVSMAAGYQQAISRLWKPLMLNIKYIYIRMFSLLIQG